MASYENEGMDRVRLIIFGPGNRRAARLATMLFDVYRAR